jgi:hypothetical protein
MAPSSAGLLDSQLNRITNSFTVRPPEQCNKYNNRSTVGSLNRWATVFTPPICRRPRRQKDAAVALETGLLIPCLTASLENI